MSPIDGEEDLCKTERSGGWFRVIPGAKGLDADIIPALLPQLAMAESEPNLLLARLALHYQLLTRERLQEILQRRQTDGETGDLGEYWMRGGWMAAEAVERLRLARDEYLRRQAPAAGPEPAAPARSDAAPAAPTFSSVRPATRPASATEPESPRPSVVPPAAASRSIEAAEVPPPRVAAQKGGTVATIGVRPDTSLHDLLRKAASLGASDLHLHAGARVKIRRFGHLIDLSEEPLRPADTDRLLRAFLSPGLQSQLAEEQSVDFAAPIPGIGRCRGAVYRQRNSISGVFRLVPPEAPTLESLGLPVSLLAPLTEHHRGLILVTGPAASGKSSTLAALVRRISEARADHIITLEDPIEYVFPQSKALVSQRQVGDHTTSFARALRAALREDPDVIVVGEMRDLETISLALTAAETGHLVFGTLHTGSAIRTLHRLLGVFPSNQQGQIRTMVSESLRAIVSQRLVTRADGRGRAAAIEVLVNTRAVANLIRENKTYQIVSMLQTGQGVGMCMLENSLSELVRQGVITRAEASRYVDDPKRLAAGGASAGERVSYVAQGSKR